MASFNDTLKEIRITELAILIIASGLFLFFLDFDEIWMYVIVIVYIFFRCRKAVPYLGTDIKGIFSKIPFKTCLLLLITNIILSISLGIVTGYLISYYPFLNYMPGYEVQESAGLTLAYLITFIDVVLVAPVSEEFIFRGVLLNRLDKRIPLIAAIVISSLLFGFLHGTFGFISAFIFGVCMCIVYLKTQNIFASISIHILNNLLAMILEVVIIDESIFKSDIGIALIMILAVISMCYVMKFVVSGYKEVTA